MAEHLTYRDAARRVRRSVRTIKRWRRGGMPMTFDGEGRRVVELGALLAWWRARMTADPVHQQRLRRQLSSFPAAGGAAVDSGDPSNGVDLPVEPV